MDSLNTPKRIVLAVGAGASQEVGLPIGTALKEQVASALAFQFALGHRRMSGDELIEMVFRTLTAASEQPNVESTQLLEAAWQICDAMPQALSIDNYLDTHKSNARVTLCGKLAIARAILSAEAASDIRVRNQAEPSRLAFSSVGETWFNAFFQLLTENATIDQLPARFSKIAIVCFNYDRCIEHFLYSAVQNYYRINPGPAAEVLGHLEIFHPFGTVGALPWQDQTDAVDFGETLSADKLLRHSEKIRTFTESTDESASNIVALRSRLLRAGQIVFLGFAFHPLNLEVLFGGRTDSAPARSAEIWGTCFGVSSSNVEEIKVELRRLTGVDKSLIELRQDLKCSALIHEYWRKLSLRSA